jgi:hypothetical protein
VLQFLVAPAELFLQVANRQVRPDSGEHFFALERLVDEVNRAELEPSHFLASLGERGQENDRAIASARIRLQAGAGFEAVHVRHHDVEQDQVRRRPLRDGDRVLAAPGGEQPVAVALERLVEHLKIRRVVVDQQNLRCVCFL